MPTSRRLVDASGADFYPTPAWATRALLHYEQFEGGIYEPACGNGAMSEVLREKYGDAVISSDLYNRGYGETGTDFLKYNGRHSNIITNPPYNLAYDFICKALNVSLHKSCFLLRLSFLESASRYNNLFCLFPPTRIRIFSERISFYPNESEGKSGGTLAYAWFVWDKQAVRRPTELSWIEPIFKNANKKKVIVMGTPLEPDIFKSTLGMKEYEQI